MYDLFLYYNQSQDALVIGPRESWGLLKVRRIIGERISIEMDYTLSHVFRFSYWKQWDPRKDHFFVNRELSQMIPQCVDENFGFCSSGYLYPNNLYESVVQVVGPWYTAASGEYVDFSQMHFKLLDNVVYNLRPVYELVSTSENKTSQRYLYHKDEQWRVSTRIGSTALEDSTILLLYGNAMRVEYENGTEWRWLYCPLHSGKCIYRRAFGHLQCRRQLPDGITCQTAGDVACDNGGTCRNDSSGISSCLCTAGFRGIQCKHRVSECTASFQTPALGSAFVARAPHYDGSIATVVCSSGEVYHSVCQNGSWQSTSRTQCRIPTTTTAATFTTSHTVWSPAYTPSVDEQIDKDSSGTIATVIVALVCVQLGFPFLCYCCVACCRSDDEQLDEELPADDGLKLETPKKSASLQKICSGFFYVSWWVWLVFIVIYFMWYAYVPLDGSTALSAAVIMAFVCLGVLYCCVFSESLCSPEYTYLTELENELTAGEQITQMKTARPTLTFKADCSHNETKSRTVLKFHDTNKNWLTVFTLLISHFHFFLHLLLGVSFPFLQ